MKPPWQIPCPFTMRSATVMVSTASPGAMRSILMPRLWLAWSSAHIARAQASASACGSGGAGALASISAGP